jgi:hypothetical protein
VLQGRCSRLNDYATMNQVIVAAKGRIAPMTVGSDWSAPKVSVSYTTAYT